MWYSTKKLAREVESFKARSGNMPPEMAEEEFRRAAEEGWQKIEDCVVQFKAGSNILSGGRFDTLSLGTWLEIVKAADLTYIPAEIVALVSAKDIFKGAFSPIKLDVHEDMLKYRGMVRLDNCGSEILKQRFGVRGEHVTEAQIQGAEQHEGNYYFVFDDRTTHGVLEYVGQIEPDGDVTHPIWWRPWVRALQVEVTRPAFMKSDVVDTWPLEWRVIVQAGQVTAVSAYYIQAPVDLTNEVRSQICDVLKETEKLLTFMREKNIQPWHPRYLDERAEDDVSFSCDFISTEHGPAFLEAGPAVPTSEENVPIEEWGAHPCNFMGRKIEGVALSKVGALSLSEFR